MDKKVLVCNENCKKRNKIYNPQDIVELSNYLEEAESYNNSITLNKLELIAKQIKNLHIEALTIIQEAKENNFLNNAKCNFKRKPNHIYHLYKNENDEYYFSMLSPKEWNYKVPNLFIGSYKLELDMSWTPVENIINKEENKKLCLELFNNGKLSLPKLEKY